MQSWEMHRQFFILRFPKFRQTSIILWPPTTINNVDVLEDRMGLKIFKPVAHFRGQAADYFTVQVLNPFITCVEIQKLDSLIFDGKTPSFIINQSIDDNTTRLTNYTKFLKDVELSYVFQLNDWVVYLLLHR